MWRDERLHRNISTLDTKDNLKVLRNLKPKKSIVEDVVTYGFIPQDVEKVSKDLVNKTHSFLELKNSIPGQTMSFLIKLSEPCSKLFEGRRVIFKDQGEFKIKEVIDDKNFTVHLEEHILPENIELTHKEVYDMKSFDKDIVSTMTVCALQEVDKTVTTLNTNTDELQQKVELLEMSHEALIQRLEALEKL